MACYAWLALRTPELANALAEGIVAQFPDKFAATRPMPMPAMDVPTMDLRVRARDGKSLDLESIGTRSMFVTVWGGMAPTAWVTEHNVDLTGLGQ